MGEKGFGMNQACAMTSRFCGALGRIHLRWGNLCAPWNWDTKSAKRVYISRFWRKWREGFCGERTYPAVGVVTEAVEEYDCCWEGRGVGVGDDYGWVNGHDSVEALFLVLKRQEFALDRMSIVEESMSYLVILQYYKCLVSWALSTNLPKKQHHFDGDLLTSCC